MTGQYRIVESKISIAIHPFCGQITQSGIKAAFYAATEIVTQAGGITVRRIASMIISCILLTSCHAVSSKELEEEISHLIQKGMPVSAAISNLRAAGFACTDTEPIPEEGFDGFANPPPRGLFTSCDRLVNGYGFITCAESLVIILDQETSKVSLIEVESPACLGTP